MSVPEAGWRYFGLCENASYQAVARGDIPVVLIGSRKRVPVHLMDAKIGLSDTASPRIGDAAQSNARGVGHATRLRLDPPRGAAELH